MTLSISMLAPSANPNMNFTCRSGNSYTSDAYGVIKNVVGQDIVDLDASNCIPLGQVGGLSSVSETAAPGSTNDSTQDYAIGSRWLDTTHNIEYIANSVAASSAVWNQVAMVTATQTLTNKTLQSPTVKDGTNVTIGTGTGSIIGQTSSLLGFYGVTAVAQPSVTSYAAVASTGAATGAIYGFTTAAQANAIVSLVNQLRAVVVSLGLAVGP